MQITHNITYKLLIYLIYKNIIKHLKNNKWNFILHTDVHQRYNIYIKCTCLREEKKTKFNDVDHPCKLFVELVSGFVNIL